MFIILKTQRNNCPLFFSMCVFLPYIFVGATKGRVLAFWKFRQIWVECFDFRSFCTLETISANWPRMNKRFVINWYFKSTTVKCKNKKHSRKVQNRSIAVKCKKKKELLPIIAAFLEIWGDFDCFTKKNIWEYYTTKNSFFLVHFAMSCVPNTNCVLSLVTIACFQGGIKKSTHTISQLSSHKWTGISMNPCENASFKGLASLNVADPKPEEIVESAWGVENATVILFSTKKTKKKQRKTHEIHSKINEQRFLQQCLFTAN